MRIRTSSAGPALTGLLSGEAQIMNVRTRDIQEKLAAAGFEPSPSSPAGFAAYLKSEIAKWARAIEAAGIARS